MPHSSSNKAPSQRQLRVGEEIRHAVATILIRNELHDPAFESISFTVSEVRISPDLKNATVYVTPLAGHKNPHGLMTRLNEVAPAIRKILNRHVVLKYSPKLFFKLDKSFDAAGRIMQLLQSERVQTDLKKAAEESGD